jgi:hypothetical protein
VRPKRFTEKVIRRILFDRNPNLTLFADKLLVRGFVRARLGDSRFLTKLYGVATSRAEVSQLSLPSKFVMKPNHASHLVKIVSDSTCVSPGELETLAEKWLSVNYFDSFQEWAYKDIVPCIMFEELLEMDGNVASDYKFFCFSGEPRFFYVAKDRLAKLRLNFYDMNKSKLPIRLEGYENFPGEFEVPPNFDNMVDVARKLSAGTDFIRVDLYNIAGRIAFGELTNYPGGGLGKFLPPEWDLKLGKYW